MGRCAGLFHDLLPALLLTSVATDAHSSGCGRLDSNDRELAAIAVGGAYWLNHVVGDFVAFHLADPRTLKCLVFNGRYDYTVSEKVSERWFNALHAPRKRLVWFENSAHMRMQEEPGRFLLRLVTDLRPLAAMNADALETSLERLAHA